MFISYIILVPACSTLSGCSNNLITTAGDQIDKLFPNSQHVNWVVWDC